jgi:hypothetical protein
MSLEVWQNFARVARDEIKQFYFGRKMPLVIQQGVPDSQPEKFRPMRKINSPSKLVRR